MRTDLRDIEAPERVVLVVDVGGTHIKVRLSNAPDEVHMIDSGLEMTPTRMIAAVRATLAGGKADRMLAEQRYAVVSMGYPGVVRAGQPAHEPVNLGAGWVGFDFANAFGRPTIVVNDAALQALGSYRGGRMLFLGLGTGLGTAMIVDNVIAPMELAHLPYRKGRSYENYAGKAGLERLGQQKWRKHVLKIVGLLTAALEVDDVVLGGGNAERLRKLPAGVRRGANSDALAGGVRLWRMPRPATPMRRSR